MVLGFLGLRVFGSGVLGFQAISVFLGIPGLTL